jgi:hypothetical protein
VIAAFVLAVVLSAACRVVTAAPLTPEAVPQAERILQLVEELQSHEGAVRENAFRQLIAIGRPAAEAVEELLSSEDEDVRTLAARIISALHYAVGPDREKIEEQVRLCIEARASGSLDRQIKESAAAIKGIPNFAHYLVESLADRREGPRERAAARLLRSTVGLMSEIEEIDTIVLDRRDGERGSVKVATDAHGKPVVLETRLALLLRSEMSPDSVIAFIACDSTVETALRVRSLRTLSARGATHAVGVLISLLNMSKGAMLVETAATLRKLTGQDFGLVRNSTGQQIEKALDNWNAWWEENMDRAEYRSGD